MRDQIEEKTSGRKGCSTSCSPGCPTMSGRRIAQVGGSPEAAPLASWSPLRSSSSSSEAKWQLWDSSLPHYVLLITRYFSQ